MELREWLLRRYRWDAGVSRYMLGVVTDDLSEDELNWQPGPGHHSIWHNVWHMYLSNDYYSAFALGLPAIWDEHKWADRIDLAPMARAFDYMGPSSGGPVPRFVIADVPDDLVDELKAPPLAQYLAYVDDLLGTTQARIEAAPEETLMRKIEIYGRHPRAYDVATDFHHVSRHIGMIEDLRGLIRGPGKGTASI
jgi:hypothetical protein